MIVEMKEDRRQWLEGRSRKMGYAKGRVNFRTCGVCGSAQWACTTTADADGKPYDDLEVSEWVESGPHGCGTCGMVAQRNPEVFAWVLSVVDWSISQRPPSPAPETRDNTRDGGV